MVVRTRITDSGVIQESVSEGDIAGATLSIEIPATNAAGLPLGTGGNIVTWAPYATAEEATTNGWYTTWADAVAAIQLLKTPMTVLQIEADPWHDEVVIPKGSWTLNNTMIVGKVGYAQGGRNWIASRDAGNQGLNQGWQYYSQQYRGHQVKLWVHPEYDAYNPCKLHSCIGLKDMFFRGQDADNGIGGDDATYYGYVENPYDSGTGTCYISISGTGDTFSEADLWKDITNNTQGDWYVTVIEVISPTVVKVDTQGNPSWLISAPGGEVTNQTWYTENNDRNNSTFDLIGRMGGKESYFSGYNSSTGTSTLYTRGISHGGPSSSDNLFDISLTGKKIYVSNIGEYSGEYTVLYVWNSDEVEIDLPHDLTGDYGSGNIVVNWTTLPTYHTDQFTLDNVDFRSAYGEFGTMNLRCGNMVLNLTGFETSVRNYYSVSCDGFLVVQSDGSPAWLGGYCIGNYYGDGYLKIYALPGMNMNTEWIDGNANIDFDVYQGSTSYIPGNSGDWNSTPYSVKNALDELAQRIYNLENP